MTPPLALNKALSYKLLRLLSDCFFVITVNHLVWNFGQKLSLVSKEEVSIIDIDYYVLNILDQESIQISPIANCYIIAFCTKT